MDSSPAIDAQEIVDIQRREASEVYRVREWRVEGLPRIVVQVLELLDGGRPLHRVFSRLGLPTKKGRAIVRKLTQMGLVESVEPLHADMRRGIHFSEEEEAFFASEVEPIDECDLPYPKLGDRVRSLIDRLRR